MSVDLLEWQDIDSAEEGGTVGYILVRESIGSVIPAVRRQDVLDKPKI